MEKNTILVVVVSVLVFIAAVQAVELVILKDKIDSGSLSTGASSRSVSAAAGTGSSSSGQGSPSLDELSGMVGGC